MMGIFSNIAYLWGYVNVLITFMFKIGFAWLFFNLFLISNHSIDFSIFAGLSFFFVLIWFKTTTPWGFTYASGTWFFIIWGFQEFLHSFVRVDGLPSYIFARSTGFF